MKGTKCLWQVLRLECFEPTTLCFVSLSFCRLQQHFNSSTFKEETAVYKNEGIDYEEIVFIDNEDVIALVGHKGGIFHQLDEEIKVPRGSSKGFYNKLVKNFTGGTKQHVRLGPHHPGTSYFTVKHYAGDVKYDYHGFLEKNKDTLFNDLVELMSNADSCSNSFVRQLFSESAASTESSKSKSKKVRGKMWGGGGCESCLAICVLPPCFLVSHFFFSVRWPLFLLFWCLFVAGWQTQCEQTISKSIGFLDGHTE